MTDDKSMERIYYMSILSLIANEKLNLPSIHRVFVTGGAENSTTNGFFWDYAFLPTVLSLLDPKALRDMFELFFSVDIDSYWGVDFMSKHGVGDWYAANDMTLFTLLHNYMR